MKILLAVDGSEASLRATQSLVAHVQWFRDRPEVHVLHVHAPVPVGLALQHVSRETLDRYYREEGESVLAPALAVLQQAGLPAVSHIHVGQAADVIVRLAAELGCEIICLGAHGRGTVGTVLLGSVAARVLQLASVPVLVSK
jgi:nucleotide-binding universal stress UspA family protein